MDPWLLFFVLLLVAVAFATAEAILPSHGVLGVCAGIAALAAVGVCFTIDRWIGLGTLLALIVLAPVAGALLVRVWQATPVGKAVVLTAVTPPVEVERLKVGQVGRTVSVLRPMGEAEFGVVTAQVVSDFGTVDPGRPVQVVSVTSDGVARVRPVAGAMAGDGGGVGVGVGGGDDSPRQFS